MILSLKRLRWFLWGHPPLYRPRISWRALLPPTGACVAAAFLIEYTVPPSALHDGLALLCITAYVVTVGVLERRVVLRQRQGRV